MAGKGWRLTYAGKLALNGTTFGRELLIVEEENDGKGFALHTTFEDRRQYYKICQKPYAFLSGMSVFSAL